jgi:hypothetical protein
MSGENRAGISLGSDHAIKCGGVSGGGSRYPRCQNNFCCPVPSVPFVQLGRSNVAREPFLGVSLV